MSGRTFELIGVPFDGGATLGCNPANLPTDASVALSASRRVMELRARVRCVRVRMSVQVGGFGFIGLGKFFMQEVFQEAKFPASFVSEARLISSL